MTSDRRPPSFVRASERLLAWSKRTATKTSKRTWYVLLGALVVLIAARVAAPYVIEWQVNKKLAEHPDYRGSIDDVDLSLLGSVIAFDELQLDKKRGAPELPFLRVRRIVVDFQWKPLLDGKVVSDLTIERPVMNLVPAATKKADPKNVDKDEEGDAVSDAAATLVPTRIRRLYVHDGAIRYKDGGTKPPVDLRLHQVEIVARGLSTEPAPEARLPSRGRATARLQDSGKLRAQIRLNAFADQPTFDLNLAVRDMDVRELRDFTRAYAGVDLEKGRFSFFTELAARNGKIEGYAKPMAKNIDVLEWGGGDEDDDFLDKVWEGAVGGVTELVEDQDEDRVAARVPIQGKFDEPGIDVWATVGSVLSNAFIEALVPKLDQSIQFSDLLR